MLPLDVFSSRVLLREGQRECKRLPKLAQVACDIMKDESEKDESRRTRGKWSRGFASGGRCREGKISERRSFEDLPG
jgi:hypothetical protein